MLTIRRSSERGYADHGWLKSFHTFSFADYHDPKHMGFRCLRVINEDRVAAQNGFETHPHRNMEIITYIVSGALEHKDSMGTTSVIHAGEVQHMSAGSLVLHSEHNPLADQETHLFQIWILPRANGGSPSYGQKSFQEMIQRQKLTLVVSPDGRDGSLKINQDANLYVVRLEARQNLEFTCKAGRGVWLHLIRGRMMVNSLKLMPGDALACENEESLRIDCEEASEALLFDLP